MENTSKLKVTLVLGWKDLGPTAYIRKEELSIYRLLDLADQAEANTLVLNAFLYVFLCKAKGLDFYSTENMIAIAEDIEHISEKMEALTRFELDGLSVPSADLRKTYLALRRAIVPKTTVGECSDEIRILLTLLFSGPSTAEQVTSDLNSSLNLVSRLLGKIEPVLEPNESYTRKLVMR